MIIATLLSTLLPWVAFDPRISAAPEPSEIVGGHPSHGDAAVVSLDRGGSPFCTGTLVAPDAVLTAAHCVDDLDAHELEIRFGADEAFDPAEIHVHPEFDADTLANDLAVLRMRRAVVIAPVALAAEPLTDGDVGRSVRIVGFGWSAASAIDSSLKREGIARLAALAPTVLRIEPGPAQTCLGDSGGPAFLDRGGHEALIGVTSAGDFSCAAYGIHTRVDVYRDDFIDDAIERALERDSGCAVQRVSSPAWLVLLPIGWRRRRADSQSAREPQPALRHGDSER